MRGLRVQDMQASRPEDIEEILRAIPDVELFNEKLQSLIFEKLLPTWHNLDAQEQVATVGRIARWQALVATRGTLGVYEYRAADPDEPIPEAPRVAPMVIGAPESQGTPQSSSAGSPPEPRQEARQFADLQGKLFSRRFRVHREE